MKKTQDTAQMRPVAAEVAETFVKRACGEWSDEEQSRLEARCAADANYRHEFERFEKSWHAIGSHAESPELMKLRESALSWIRRENVNRWKGKPQRARPWLVAAAVAGIAVIAGIGIQLSPYGYRPGLYTTGIGQQRELPLPDGSRVELDAATRLQVQFSDTARTIRLFEGQAQFSVAKDPTRPFRVQAGDRTIVAIGTVFTVEYFDQKVHVATVEGKVAVLDQQPAERAQWLAGAIQDSVSITAGEEVRIAADGKLTKTANADISAATAWRDGNVIFRNEPLGEAVRRLNRYAPLRLKIADESLATLRISGVFEKGDSVAFARSVQAYYPVSVDSDSDAITLRFK
jgi:transmembrane sensor